MASNNIHAKRKCTCQPPIYMPNANIHAGLRYTYRAPLCLVCQVCQKSEKIQGPFLHNSFCKSIDLRHILKIVRHPPRDNDIHANLRYTCQPPVYMPASNIHPKCQYTCQPPIYMLAFDIHANRQYTCQPSMYMPAVNIHARLRYTR